MRKRTMVTLVLVGCLVAGLLGPADAAKRKKKKKAPVLVQADQKMFLGTSETCSAPVSTLSLADGQDLECWYVRAGALHDAGEGQPAPVGSDPWVKWIAADGVPLKLDSSKPFTGEISTGGVCGLLTNVPCAPAGIALGQVKLTVKLVGVAGGQEVELGEYVEEFTSTPGPHHTSMVEIALDPALNGVEFTELTMWTRIGGQSIGHGVYKLLDPSSFVTVPTLVPAS